ncbi:prenyltransferase [Saxibacter everestensis]|uniref:Prenyltransferase n=1 Tax=Saxibacter everestensis TaxID=2909229 RepID=A0ABY8QSX4_9MICO|nr:prenyltransferase [Brevibacteriaceae bacterium ZFBP1038]
MTAERRRHILFQLLQASRPVSWVNTAFPFAAAYFLTTREIDLALIVGAIFFLVPYNLALYGINDVFDYESDLANPRKGGLEGALLSRSTHRVTIISAVAVCLPFVIVLLVLGNPLSWSVLGISLFAVAAYSVPGLRFKEVPFLDSITSSTHFVSPAVYGLALAGAPVTPGLLLLLAGFLLWGIASHAFGAVQDVLPDRAAGIHSIATALGAKWAVRFAVVVWVAAGSLVLWAGWPGLLATPLVLGYVAVALPYVSLSDEASERANRGWKQFLWINYVVGFLITMLLIFYVS